MPRPRKTPPNPELTEQAHDGGTQTDLVKAAIEVFNPDFDSLNLHQKIAKITGMIGGVEKRGYNAFHKYPYVMEADLVAAVRQYLAAAGIVIIPNAHKWEYHGDICMVDIEYVVTDGNEAFTFSMPGAGSDRGDKGVYKAITGSMKYALMKLFKIETGDDPEGDTRVDERTAVSQQRQEQPPVRVTAGSRAGVRRGGHTEKASAVQIRRVAELTKELDIERPQLAEMINALGTTFVLPEEEVNQQKAVLAALQEMPAEKIGELIIDLVELGATRDAERTAVAADSAGYGY
jgi:hypothetical protein